MRFEREFALVALVRSDIFMDGLDMSLEETGLAECFPALVALKVSLLVMDGARVHANVMLARETLIAMRAREHD